MTDLSQLAEINRQYSCVIETPTKATNLESKTWSIGGTAVRLPSRSLFVTDDGSIYVLVKKRGKNVEYASLASLIEAIQNTKVIENFSTRKPRKGR